MDAFFDGFDYVRQKRFVTELRQLGLKKHMALSRKLDDSRHVVRLNPKRKEPRLLQKHEMPIEV